MIFTLCGSSFAAGLDATADESHKAAVKAELAALENEYGVSFNYDDIQAEERMTFDSVEEFEQFMIEFQAAMSAPAEVTKVPVNARASTQTARNYELVAVGAAAKVTKYCTIYY